MVGMMGSKEIYKNSPKLTRGEDGKMGVSKKEAPETGKDEADAGEAGMPVEMHDKMARHNLDRHMLHAKHEHEHAMHKGGDKKEMHKRHKTEIEEMLKKHEGEMHASSAGDAPAAGGRADMMSKGEPEEE